MPDLRMIEGQPLEAVARWLGTLSTSELRAIAAPCPGDLGGLSEGELTRLAAGEPPAAVLGFEEARRRGLTRGRLRVKSLTNQMSLPALNGDGD